MKKISFLLVLAVSLQFTACKKEVKKETPTLEKVEKTYPYSLKSAEKSVFFTAYKTTEKIPVKGEFKKVEVIKGGNGNTMQEALNGAEFKIPVSSIETKDSSRNFKIVKFFFGAMENTITLTGKLNLEEGTNNGFVEFTMNGNTQKLPFKYIIEGKKFNLKTTLNIDNWNTQSAITSLNKACKDLHKGADGISKTWSEVAIDVLILF